MNREEAIAAGITDVDFQGPAASPQPEVQSWDDSNDQFPLAAAKAKILAESSGGDVAQPAALTEAQKQTRDNCLTDFKVLVERCIVDCNSEDGKFALKCLRESLDGDPSDLGISSIVCGQNVRDRRIVEGIDNRSIVYYGPCSCEQCGELIVRGSNEQGFGDIAFNYPQGVPYPNHNWIFHNCKGVVVAASGSGTLATPETPATNWSLSETATFKKLNPDQQGGSSEGASGLLASTPRCPKCGHAGDENATGFWFQAYGSDNSHCPDMVRVSCQKCNKQFVCESVADFRQFFPASSGRDVGLSHRIAEVLDKFYCDECEAQQQTGDPTWTRDERLGKVAAIIEEELKK